MQVLKLSYHLAKFILNFLINFKMILKFFSKSIYYINSMKLKVIDHIYPELILRIIFIFRFNLQILLPYYQML